jgi:hypothetical protein
VAAGSSNIDWPAAHAVPRQPERAIVLAALDREELRRRLAGREDPPPEGPPYLLECRKCGLPTTAMRDRPGTSRKKWCSPACQVAASRDRTWS